MFCCWAHHAAAVTHIHTHTFMYIYHMNTSAYTLQPTAATTTGTVRQRDRRPHIADGNGAGNKCHSM